MSATAKRRAICASAVVVGAGSNLVATASPAAAHSVEGGELPAPSWLLAYGGAFLVLITGALLVSSWTKPRRLLATGLSTVADEEVEAAPKLHVGHLIGTLAYVAVVLAAIIGPDSAAANVAPLAVLVGWWIGVPVAALLLGDVVRAVNPFQLPVAVLERLRGGSDGHEAPRAPAWTAALFLGAFTWFFLAYHRPGSPRALAVLLIAYALAAIAGGVVWGRGWLARGEGFAGLSAAVAQLSWRRDGRRPVPGLAPLMVVWIGGTAFDAVTSTSFWRDVRGTAMGWTATMIHTVGLVWLIAIVGGLYLGAVRLAERNDAGAGESTTRARPLATVLGLALVPLAAGWFLTHDLTLLLGEGQNLLVLISDPIGRGWDLFGTLDRSVDFGIVEEPWVRIVQLVLLGAGHLLAVAVAHDVGLRLGGRRSGARVTWSVAVLAAVSFATAVLLILDS